MRYSRHFTFAALFAVAPFAMAQSTTDITVTGVITPAACTPMLSGGGEFNFGKIAAQDLNQNEHTGFVSPTKQLNVACNAPTRFALRAIDGRAGTQPTVSRTNFGLGLSGVERIGSYQLLTQRYFADGDVAVDVLESFNGGDSWLNVQGNSSFLFNTTGPNLTAVGSVGASEPGAFQTLTTDLVVRMAIAPANDLTLTDEVKIDGAATLEVVYL